MSSTYMLTIFTCSGLTMVLNVFEAGGIMNRKAKSKRQAAVDNILSVLLNQQENEQLQEMLGRRCESLCTTVAQLLMALPHSPHSWSLQYTGVLCFVKDNPQRSYFLRLYDVKAGKQLWEQEVFEQMSYKQARPFFHIFAGDECQVGLNFADLQEAESFFSSIDSKIAQRKNRQDRGALPPTPVQNDRGELPSFPNQNAKMPPMATIDIHNPDIQASRYRSMAVPPTPAVSKGKKDKKESKKSKSKKGSKLSKADIGAPSGFTHVSHVGMDPSNLDPDLMKLLSTAGISEADLKDEETAQMIYDVIEQAGGMAAVKEEVNKQSSAPPPFGRQGPLPPIPGSSSAPAPPPSRSRSSLPPIPGGGSSRGGPTPPSARGSLPPVPPSGRRQSLPPPPHSAARPSPPPHGRLPVSHPGPPPPVSHPGLPPPVSHPGLPPSVSHPASHRTMSHVPPPPSQPVPTPPPSASQPPILPSHPKPGVMSSTPPAPPQPKGGGPAPPPPPPLPPPPPAPARMTSAACSTPPSGGGDSGPPACSDGGVRGALLDQIRLGKKLKTVSSSNELPPPSPEDSGEGIVGALMMVMQKRCKVIHSSDEGEDEDVEDDDDDEWDD
ncbi:hypothetical protein ACEWY4_001242 [Coilia grayii]|uniref:Wiskott-Aldrich syndrome protein n=1 Tax=Coilia grayii TaxID=363190 RepID=A0ABD1KYZ3_9TELE